MFFVSKANCPCVHVPGLNRPTFSFQGCCLVTSSMGQVISYRDQSNFFFAGSYGGKKTQDRKGREETESLDSTGEQRGPRFSTFPSSHFVWELCSKRSLLVPVVCENH